jgi:heptosyltransferase-2
MKIAIVKLGADGDVLRTIPLANALKNNFPHSEITWIVKGEIGSLLEQQKSISKIIKLPFQTEEQFDALYNFDIDDQATSLADSINARKKYGFSKKDGYLCTFNLGAEYYLNTIFDDQLKKDNKKTYQEMMFEVAELPASNLPYHIVLTSEDKQFAQNYLTKNNLLNKTIIGIHMGASSRWPSKVWHEAQLINFVKLVKHNHYEIILFGGPNEIKGHTTLISKLKEQHIIVHQNNPHNTKREFAALVSACNVIVCSDSLALHVSLGLGRKTIALFFCTSPNEVESYGLLTKLISPQLYDFFPERSDLYDISLVSSISSREVLKAVKDIL